MESVKAAADIYAPLAGVVTEVNAELADAPEKINQDAYSAWIFKFKPDQPGELSELLDAATYEASAAAEKH